MQVKMYDYRCFLNSETIIYLFVLDTLNIQLYKIYYLDKFNSLILYNIDSVRCL